MPAETIPTRSPKPADQPFALTRRVAWFGVGIDAPEEWNLTFQQGRFKQGGFALSDLYATQLEVRWRQWPKRRISREMARMTKQLERKGNRVDAVAQKPKGANQCFWVRPETGPRMALLATARRILEITWAQTGNVATGRTSLPDGVPPAMLKTLVLDEDENWWTWRVYNCVADMPARWPLKKTKLVPGLVTVEFARRRAHIVAGAWSMADRLLAGRDVMAWAREAIPLVKTSDGGAGGNSARRRHRFGWIPRRKRAAAGGVWTPYLPGVMFSTRVRKGLSRSHERLGLWHDAEKNCIIWLHASGPKARDPVMEEAMARFFAHCAAAAAGANPA